MDINTSHYEVKVMEWRWIADPKVPIGVSVWGPSPVGGASHLMDRTEEEDLNLNLVLAI